MKLSNLAILLGAVYALPNLFGFLKPAEYGKALRAFPRSFGWGLLLMPLGTAWFLFNLNAETISDFAQYKGVMLLAFGALGIGTCIFVRDYLAVRGLAVVLLLLAWFTLNAARFKPSEWRLVIVVWAYLWVVMGMWLTVQPWRMRDYFFWLTDFDGRVRLHTLIRQLSHSGIPHHR